MTSLPVPSASTENTRPPSLASRTKSLCCRCATTRSFRRPEELIPDGRAVSQGLARRGGMWAGDRMLGSKGQQTEQHRVALGGQAIDRFPVRLVPDAVDDR